MLSGIAFKAAKCIDLNHFYSKILSNFCNEEFKHRLLNIIIQKNHTVVKNCADRKFVALDPYDPASAFTNYLWGSQHTMKVYIIWKIEKDVDVFSWAKKFIDHNKDRPNTLKGFNG